MPTCGSYCVPVVASSRATWSTCTGCPLASSTAAIDGSPPRNRISWLAAAPSCSTSSRVIGQLSPSMNPSPV